MMKKCIFQYTVPLSQQNYTLNTFCTRNMSTSSGKANENIKQQETTIKKSGKCNRIQNGLSILALSKTKSKGIPILVVDYWDLLGKCITDCIEQLSHKKEVSEAVNKINAAQSAIKSVADKKREILFNLEGLRKELQKLYDDIKHSDDKTSERYLELVKKEVYLLRMEKDLNSEFKIVDANERLLFNDLDLALIDLYQKERKHNSYIRMWSTAITLCTCLGVAVFRNHMERKKKKAESWGNFFKRNTGQIYGWIWPQQKK